VPQVKQLNFQHAFNVIITKFRLNLLLKLDDSIFIVIIGIEPMEFIIGFIDAKVAILVNLS